MRGSSPRCFFTAAAPRRGRKVTCVILWVICLFFMSVGPKSVYMLVSLLDYPAGWVRRKKVRLFSRIGLAAGALTLLVMIWGATAGRSRIVEEDLIVRSG